MMGGSGLREAVTVSLRGWMLSCRLDYSSHRLNMDLNDPVVEKQKAAENTGTRDETKTGAC